MAEEYGCDPSNIECWKDECVIESIQDVFDEKMVHDFGISFVFEN
jgi:hypothetical protein